MLLEVQLMGIIVIAVGFGLLIGKQWAEDVAKENADRLRRKIDYYESHYYLDYPGEGNW